VSGKNWFTSVTLDAEDGLALHRQLLDVLRQWLNTGEARPGDPVPTEAELCRLFGISRGTVRRALHTLSEEGLISRRPGKGTLVVRPRLRCLLNRYLSFTESCLEWGVTPGARVLTLKTKRASGAAARSLELPVGAPVTELVRVRFADGEPVCVDSVLIPEKLCPGLTRYDFSSASLFQILADDYRIVLFRARAWLRPVLAEKKEARLLEVPTGSPMLLLETLANRRDDTPVVLGRELWRGDRIHYLLEMIPSSVAPRVRSRHPLRPKDSARGTGS
jgi:GntR family transcriptional regulator